MFKVNNKNTRTTSIMSSFLKFFLVNFEYIWHISKSLYLLICLRWKSSCVHFSLNTVLNETKSNWIKSNFLKAVFHNFYYLVHSWILCPEYYLAEFTITFLHCRISGKKHKTKIDSYNAFQALKTFSSYS